MDYHRINVGHSDYNNTQLQKHLEIFEDVMLDDQDQFAAQYKLKKHLDTTDAVEVLGHLQKKYQNTAAHPYLMSILMHLLQVPGRWQ